jgi:outer membrane receptor protein involved in Fe transport
MYTGLAVVCASLLTGLFAQTPPSPPETVVLDPFQVTSKTDVGYLASSTLGGSRLNTPLRDTPASISVMTAEFLTDIGASNMDQVLLYANNLQKNINDEVAGNGNGNSVTEFNSTYRVRGIRADTARNYFTWTLPSDVYNIERVDDSRGPNSILFGIGSAGGIVNASTKVARPNKDAYKLEGTVSSHDSIRGSLDLNKVLIPGKLALRLNAVHEDSKTFRYFEFNKSDIVDLAATYKPNQDTTLRFEFETGEIQRNLARPWGMIDTVSVWDATGRPTPAALVANAALGIGRFAAGTARVTLNELTGQLYDMRGTLNTTLPAALQQPIITGLPSSINPSGPGAITTIWFTDYTLNFERRIHRNSYVQLAYNHQDYNFLSFDISDGDANNLRGDPNAKLGASINPNAGSYYMETTWYRRHRKESLNTLRATLATELDLGKAGRHRLAAMGEKQRNSFWRDEGREYWNGTPFNADPANAANLVFRRTYITPGDYSTYRASNGPTLINGLVDPVSGRTLSSTWRQRNANTDDDPSKLTSVLLSDQAYFWNDKVVLTAGYRRDSVKVEDRGTTIDPVTKEIIIDYATVTPFAADANTRTLGGVGHVNNWLSAFFNKSNSVNLPIAAHRILPDSGRAPNWKGAGQDFGLLIEMAEGKYALRATRFETSTQGETNFRNVVNIVTNRNTRVLAALQTAGQVTASDVTARTVNVNTARSDRDSEGYEFSLIANPTKQWRVSVNYSITDAIESNIFPEVRAWAADAIAFWTTKNTSLVTSSGITIANEIVNLNTEIADQITAENVAEVGNRREKFNVFTRYDATGYLKGAFIGGGWRYQGPVVMGRNSSNALQFGNSSAVADALLGYSGKLHKDRIRYTIQLNVSNVFGNDDPLIYRRTPDDLYVTRAQLVDGRAYRLSTTLSF